MSSSYRLALDDWLSQLEIKATTVVDLGGAQLPVPKRVKRWEVKRYLIVDLPEPHEGNTKPDIELDLNRSKYYFTGHPDVVLEPYQSSADVVFCLETLDYIFNPLAAFGVMHCLLRPGGQAYVSCGLFYPTHNPIAADMLRYTEFALKRLALETGLHVGEIVKRRPETDAIERLWRQERMRAAKGYDHNTTGFIATIHK